MGIAVHSVLINGRFLSDEPTGVQRYAAGVLTGLESRAATGELPFSVDVLKRLPLRTADRSVAGKHVWEQVVLRRRFRAGGYRLLINLANSGPIGLHASASVIFDMAPFVVPEHFSRPYIAKQRLMTRSLARSQVVITISDRAKAEIVEAFGLQPESVVVAMPGVDGCFWPQPGRSAIPGRFLLFVGGHDPRKNLDFIIELWPTIQATFGGQLVVSTRGHLPSFPPHAITGARGVTIEVAPSDDRLRHLYSDCASLLWPSSYEGFGLPLAEVQACGRPFISTDVGASAAIRSSLSHVLPLEADVWRRAIGESFASPSGPRQACMKASNQFTWDATAATVAAAVTQALPGA